MHSPISHYVHTYEENWLGGVEHRTNRGACDRVATQGKRADGTGAEVQTTRHGMEPPVEVSPSPPCDATAANSEQKSSRGAYRSRCKPSGARPFETGVQEAAPPAEPLREPCQFDYDRARYPFAELVAEALGLSDPIVLATLARCPDM